MTYRSFVRFAVKKGHEAAFEKSYRDGEMLERAAIIPGFLGGEFLRLTEDSCVYGATALWDSEASYRQWQAAYATALPQDKVADMIDAIEDMAASDVFEVVTAVSAAPSDNDRRET